MIEDIRTVVWKERRSLFRQPGSRFRIILTAAIPVCYFGIVGPLQSGAGFATGADPWFIATVLPLLAVIMTAPDSFAGERERKTLRTLLASRLPDSAILWAKIGFSVVLAMGLMISTFILAFIVVNLFADVDGLVSMEAGRAVFMLTVSVLLSGIAAGAAVLVSLRSKTVQQAQQTLAAAFFVIPTVAGPILLLLSDDGDSRPVQELFQRLGTTAGRFALIVSLMAFACILLVAAQRNFRRSTISY